MAVTNLTGSVITVRRHTASVARDCSRCWASSRDKQSENLRAFMASASIAGIRVSGAARRIFHWMFHCPKPESAQQCWITKHNDQGLLDVVFSTAGSGAGIASGSVNASDTTSGSGLSGSGLGIDSGSGIAGISSSATFCQGQRAFGGTYLEPG